MASPKAKAPKQRAMPDDLEAVVREALLAAPGLKSSQLKKALPKPYQAFAKEALALTRELAARGEVCRHLSGKTEAYFPRDPLATLDESVPARLADGPLDKDALKALANEVAPGHGAVFEEWFKRASARGIIFEHAAAPRSKKKRFGNEPDIAKNLAPVITALRKALAKTDELRISRQRVALALLSELGVSAPPPAGSNGSHEHSAPRDQFLSALSVLQAESPRQALLSVRELRARLLLNKEQFDSVALELSRDGAVSLHHHDHPTSLTDSERHQLVQDARGNYYIGIAPRRGQ